MEIKDYCDIHGEPICVGDYVVIKRYGLPAAEGFIQSVAGDLVMLKNSNSETFSYLMNSEDTIEVTKKNM